MKEYKIIESFKEISAEQMTFLSKKLSEKKGEEAESIFARIKSGSQKIVLLESNKEVIGIILYTGKASAYMDFIWTKNEENKGTETETNTAALFLIGDLIENGTKTLSCSENLETKEKFFLELEKKDYVRSSTHKNLFSFYFTDKGIEFIKQMNNNPFFFIPHK